MRTDILSGELKKIISDFLRCEIFSDNPAIIFQFPMQANYRCSAIARALADYINWLNKPNLVATTYAVEGIDPIHNHGYAHPENRGENFWHEVCVVNNEIVIDLSYRQLDSRSEFPFIKTVSEFKTLWKAVNTEPDIYDRMVGVYNLFPASVVNEKVKQYKTLSQVLQPNGKCYDGYEDWHTKVIPADYPLTLIDETTGLYYVYTDHQEAT